MRQRRPASLCHGPGAGEFPGVVRRHRNLHHGPTGKAGGGMIGDAGQISMFPPMTPTDRATYGNGVQQRPIVPGRAGNPHMEAIYLDRLLPLAGYDKIIVLFSGGKDSLACVLDLLERGVPREKIELWHHDIDGGHPTRRMDWPVTQAYVRAVAEYLGLTLRVSWRVNGFWGRCTALGQAGRSSMWSQKPERSRSADCQRGKPDPPNYGRKS